MPVVENEPPAVFGRFALFLLLALLLGETTINYVDRQVLSVLAPVLREEFGLSNSQYAAIVNAFLIVYAVAFGLAGFVLDRIGVGRGLTISVIWWSIADLLHGFALGPLSLGVMRGVLAIGEAPAWPAFAKAVAEWVPERARLLAIGICNSGSSIGAMIAPPLVAWIASTMGWRAAFFGTSMLGFMWAAAFIWFRRLHPGMDQSESAIVSQPGVSWQRLLSYRQMWGIFACRFFADPLWYFFIFWIPEFLARERGLNLAGIGKFAGIPFLVSAFSNVGVGYLSLLLQRRGWSVNRVRKTFMAASALLSPVVVLAVKTHSLGWTMTFISAAICFWTFWSVAVHTLAGDFFPPRAVASAYGVAGVGSTLGSAISQWAVGRVLDATHSYTYVFIGLTLLLPIGLMIGWPLLGRIERVRGLEGT